MMIIVYQFIQYRIRSAAKQLRIRTAGMAAAARVALRRLARAAWARQPECGIATQDRRWHALVNARPS
eukprot:4129113-Pleurochrysis_carterae.AAC.1